MITIRDSIKLAYTKLRTRRIRLVVVLIISSLLFSGLIAGSLIAAGAFASLEQFSEQGFAKRYIVAGSYTSVDSINFSDPLLITQAEKLQKEETAQKTAEAKRLGIEYNADPNQQAIVGESDQKYLAPNTLISQKILAEKEAANPSKLDLARFKEQIGVASHFYEGRRVAIFSGTNLPTLSVLKDGKELRDGAGGHGNYFGSNTTKGLGGFTKDWNLLDSQLLTPFVLKGQNLRIGADGSIPVIASYSAAQETLKLSPLGPKATAQEKKQRLEEVRHRIAGVSFEVCYRNYTSEAQVQAAQQQQAEIKLNSKQKDYPKPSLVYAPSDIACDPPVVQRDVRTPEQKRYQTNQAAFERKFGKADPQSQIMKIRIVGVSADGPSPTAGINAIDLLSSLTQSSVASNWASPLEFLGSVAPAQDYFKLAAMPNFEVQQVYFAEYDSAEAARTALTDKTCATIYPGQPADPLKTTPVCSRESRPFNLTTFGSASIAMDGLKKQFRTIQLYAALIIGGVAAIIVMGMIGRIIADARRETAIFRAIGANRLSIAQIYIVYTVMIGLLSIIIALIIGFVIALWVDSQFSADMSINMALLFNVQDLSQQFHFYTFDIYDVVLISTVILGASIVGSLIPIAHNVQRNPIRDMREE